MSADPGWYPDPHDPTLVRWWDGSTWTSRFKRATASGAPAAATVSEPELAPLQSEYERLRAELVEMRDLILLQEVGIYEYAHPLEDSAQYKDALAALRLEVRAVVKSGAAVTGTKKWAINGSEKDGAKMVADFSKLMLRAYNSEADNTVRSLRPYALRSAVERLEKMRQSISKLGASMKIEITDRYHGLRLKELELTADYENKLAVEKEQERERRARLKEEEVARREYEREQERLEKEKTHYEQALNAVRINGDVAAAAQMTEKLEEIQHAIEGVVTRAANVRAGYVYVISNIGAFGERMVKIGLTRRLDPMDRVRELGDASVPFRFDVHAMIFSDDAVGLETSLHQRFAEKRVNFVNLHREHFYVNPVEVKAALLELEGSLLTFVERPEALEWHQSQTVRMGMNPLPEMRRSRVVRGGDRF